MDSDHMTGIAQTYLHILCDAFPNRYTGSESNRAAASHLAEHFAAFNFAVETPPFDCIDWRESGVSLSAGETDFEAFASPFADGCDVRAPLHVITTVDELAAADLAGRVVLLRGAIAAEQLMPKNFPFYNPDEHKHIISLLEAKRPAALITATGRNPQMAGAVYPFPMFEDGDFDIPSVFMTAEDGGRLAAHAGQTVTLVSRAERIPAAGSNVIARKVTDATRKIVSTAHFDAKQGTPGAIDNASGVIVLMLLAELLADYRGTPGIELVAFNGEDYYSAPGQQQYLSASGGDLDHIDLVINIDGVSYHKGRVAFSLYGCPDDIQTLAHDTFGHYDALIQGDPWHQGDHMPYVMAGRPALAFTSEHVAELMAEIVHTEKDIPAIVDPTLLAETAAAIHHLILRLAGLPVQIG